VSEFTTIENSENLALEASKASNSQNGLEHAQQVRQNAKADKLSHLETPKPKSSRTPTNSKEYAILRAMAILVREMRRYIRLSGDDQTTTLQSKMHYTSSFCKLGNYESARALGAYVVDARQYGLGADHPEILDAMCNLAITMNNQTVALQKAGELYEAEPLTLKAMAIIVKTRGANSLEAACSYSATESLMSLKCDKE
jgi:hypothetical protein